MFKAALLALILFQVGSPNRSISTPGGSSSSSSPTAAGGIQGVPTASLPACGSTVPSGYVAFDTTLGQLVLCNGTAYVTKVGTTVLFSTAVAATTTGTIIETVGTYNLPAGFLDADGQFIVIEADVSCIDTDSKTLTINFGATTLTAIPYTVCGASGGSTNRAIVTRRSTTTQIASSGVTTSNNGGGARIVLPGETLSGAVTIQMRLTTPTTAGDATLEAWRVISFR